MQAHKIFWNNNFWVEDMMHYIIHFIPQMSCKYYNLLHLLLRVPFISVFRLRNVYNPWYLNSKFHLQIVYSQYKYVYGTHVFYQANAHFYEWIFVFFVHFLWLSTSVLRWRWTYVFERLFRSNFNLKIPISFSILSLILLYSCVPV